MVDIHLRVYLKEWRLPCRPLSLRMVDIHLRVYLKEWRLPCGPLSLRMVDIHLRVYLKEWRFPCRPLSEKFLKRFCSLCLPKTLSVSWFPRMSSHGTFRGLKRENTQ
jgi:hypothetical protein